MSAPDTYFDNIMSALHFLNYLNNFESYGKIVSKTDTYELVLTRYDLQGFNILYV